LESRRRRTSCRILARNWRAGRDEIDLVCRDGNVLVFVEVKARVATALVPGYFAVDKRKKQALRRACHAYLKRLRPKPVTFRFDIVEVSTTEGRKPEILHFENIPLFPKGYQG
jgi:putative endonuclease